jgi:hypothetical protein
MLVRSRATNVVQHTISQSTTTRLFSVPRGEHIIPYAWPVLLLGTVAPFAPSKISDKVRVWLR